LDITNADEHWRLISTHFPHCGYSDTDYEHALEILARALPQNRRTTRTCIGVDANAVVGKQTDHDDPEVLGQHGCGDRNPRGFCFLLWARCQRLVLANTFYQKRYEDMWTHKSWQDGDTRHIDYILFDVVLRPSLVDAVVLPDLN
jgi:hypothetical protein